MAKRSTRTASTRRRKSSSGCAVWVSVLIGVVLAVVALGLVFSGALGSGDNTTTQSRHGDIPPAPNVTREPPKPVTYPELEPWNGLSQGMTMKQVRQLFGDPQKVTAYKGKETWEIYEDAEGSGIFRSRGAKFGKWVRIKFDQSGKVIMFWHHDAENTNKTSSQSDDNHN